MYPTQRRTFTNNATSGSKEQRLRYKKASAKEIADTKKGLHMAIYYTAQDYILCSQQIVLLSHIINHRYGH
jgi:hypothetical protein